jgi:hypothetical protein
MKPSFEVSEDLSEDLLVEWTILSTLIPKDLIADTTLMMMEIGKDLLSCSSTGKVLSHACFLSNVLIVSKSSVASPEAQNSAARWPLLVP